MYIRCNTYKTDTYKWWCTRPTLTILCCRRPHRRLFVSQDHRWWNSQKIEMVLVYLLILLLLFECTVHINISVLFANGNSQNEKKKIFVLLRIKVLCTYDLSNRCFVINYYYCVGIPSQNKRAIVRVCKLLRTKIKGTALYFIDWFKTFDSQIKSRCEYTTDWILT